jgi:hypothetical protein
MRYQTIGESDECGCLQCRGIELPAWLAQLDELIDAPNDDTRAR